MIDNPVIEACYVVLVLVAWAWALSQLRAALQLSTVWRWAVAAWMLAKAGFLTLAAWTWWFNDFPELAFLVAIVLLTLTHAVAFGLWLRLPEGDAPPVPTHPPRGSWHRAVPVKWKLWNR